MKKVLCLIVDLLIIYGSIILVFYFLTEIDMLEEFPRNFEAFVKMVPFIGILYIILMYSFRLYILYKNISELIYTIFLISISLIIGIMGICFLVRDIALAFPRSVILLSGVCFFILLNVWRISLWYSLRKWTGVKKITIISNDADMLLKVLTNKYAESYRVENLCDENDPLLSSKIEFVDEVFMTSDVHQKARMEILPLCIKHQKPIRFIPKYFDLSIMSSTFEKLDDIPAFRISSIGLSLEERTLKRAIDLLFSSIATLILAPFGLILALLIKMDGGTVFYIQERLTKKGEIFNIYKFRTMIPDAEKISGPVLANEKDPRITKLGHFLRATRLDEVPQLFNILKGDMTIVGPRPERPFFAEQFESTIPEYRYRLSVKAGLTGLAQVEGKYNTSVENKLRYDLIYINNYSVLRDLLIMLQTVKILLLKSSTEGIDAN
jgi:exopolysaccharide biosynthesis polyprenyl glycosylphosphotransferase